LPKIASNEEAADQGEDDLRDPSAGWTIEILGLEGESTNENWTISLENQGKFIMV
jgi:hypothetical protein